MTEPSTASEIKIPEAESTQFLLRAVEEAIVQTKVDLAARTVLVKEISEMKNREIELEEEISNARSAIFMLFYETYYLKELENIEAYSGLLERELEKIETAGAPKATDPAKEKS